MSKKIEKENRERAKALGDILVAECKLANCSIKSIEAILESGAAIDYKNSAPLLTAAKAHNYPLIKFLIEKGAQLNDLAVSYITSICDYKGYDEKNEEQFFELIDLIQAKRGGGIKLFVPYINSLAVLGRRNKLDALMQRYGFEISETAAAVDIRIIFEIINNGHDEMLAFIESNRNWLNLRTVDLCTSCDEWMVLEYILHRKKMFPSDLAVAEALFLGNEMTLTVLQHAGYNFSGKPLFKDKAQRAADVGRMYGIEFLNKAINK